MATLHLQSTCVPHSQVFGLFGFPGCNHFVVWFMRLLARWLPAGTTLVCIKGVRGRVGASPNNRNCFKLRKFKFAEKQRVGWQKLELLINLWIARLFACLPHPTPRLSGTPACLVPLALTTCQLQTCPLYVPLRTFISQRWQGEWNRNCNRIRLQFQPQLKLKLKSQIESDQSQRQWNKKLQRAVLFMRPYRHCKITIVHVHRFKLLTFEK